MFKMLFKQKYIVKKNLLLRNFSKTILKNNYYNNFTKVLKLCTNKNSRHILSINRLVAISLIFKFFKFKLNLCTANIIILNNNYLNINYNDCSIHINNIYNMNIGIYQKCITSQRSIWNSCTISVILRDLECLLGTAVFWKLSVISIWHIKDAAHLLQNFNDYFSDMLMTSSDVNSTAVGISLILMGARGDIDQGIDSLKNFFETASWKKSQGNYKSCVTMLSFFWRFYWKRCYCTSIVFRMSGKFSRHLLTQARDFQYIFGAPYRSTAEIGCVYRYRDAVTTTGTYSMHLWFFTKNLVSKFQIKHSVVTEFEKNNITPIQKNKDRS